jgi:hypothetical protein
MTLKDDGDVVGKARGLRHVMRAQANAHPVTTTLM